MKSVKFEFTFQDENAEYQFSYSIPFTYSELFSQIKGEKNQYIHVSKLCHSLSGVEIPLLTISSPDRDN